MKGFKFVQLKGHAFYQGEIIKKYQKYIDKILKNLLQSHCANSNQTWHKAPLGEGESSFSNKEPFNSQEDNGFFSSLNQIYDIMICVYWFELF